MGTYYVTTPIYYVNSKPHIGSAYTTILADTLARYHRLIGDDTMFLTGTDEHGVNIMRTAEKLGKHPKEFCDEVSAIFRKVFDTYNISYDRFIRTTDEDHEKVVQHVFKTMYEKGDIYKGEYRGYYCPKCETFYSPDELVDGKYCPIHGIEVEEVAEETYFFKWSKYEKDLLKWYEENKDAIVPESRYNEIYTFVKNGLKDVSVTRITVPWGITVPIDPKHTVYVWFDALINYITGIGYPFDMERFNKYWPHVRHILGKDILRHHAAMWPAMLMSLGIKPPHKLIVHGWWMMGGKKMSKSGGNIADPLELVKEVSMATGVDEKFAVDIIRYFVIIDGPQREDKEFSMELLFRRYNSDLVNDYGNLIYRIVGFAKKKKIESVEPLSSDTAYRNKLEEIFKDHLRKYRESFDNDDAAGALKTVSEFVRALNKYVDETKPWSAEEGVRETIIYYVLDGIRLASLMLLPFIPTVASYVLELIGAGEVEDWTSSLQVGKLPAPVKVPVDMKPLFPRIDVDKYLKDIEKVEKEQEKKEEKKVEEKKVDIIEYDDFAKLDLRVGKIVEAGKHPNADKLLLLKVDLGEESPRTILAGVAQWYKPEELVGKEIVVVANLKPRKMRGISPRVCYLLQLIAVVNRLLLLQVKKWSQVQR